MNTTAAPEIHDLDDARSIRALITAAEFRIAPFVPPDMSVAQVAQLCYVATKKNPKLLECTPESIVQSVCVILSWQLVIGQTAYLVPYGKVCTPVADYKGLAELMVASGAVLHVFAKCVYVNDAFDYHFGLEPMLRHDPESDPKKRGPIRAAYVILTLRGNIKVFEVMSVEDIEVIRQRHSVQWKSGPLEPWYAKKTVVRQVAKMVPKSPKLRVAMRVMEQEQEIEETGEVPEPVAQPVVQKPRALTTGPAQPIPITRPAHESKPIMAGGYESDAELRAQDQALVAREANGRR